MEEKHKMEAQTKVAKTENGYRDQRHIESTQINSSQFRC